MECDEVRPCLGYSRSILPFTIRRAAGPREPRWRSVTGEPRVTEDPRVAYGGKDTTLTPRCEAKVMRSERS